YFPEKRVQLHSLQHLVHIVGGALVIESDDQPQRDEIARERIHEASAEAVFRNRPAKGVHDGIERLQRLPDFLDPQRENLWVIGWNFLPLQIRLRQCAASSLGEDGYLRG